MSTREQFIEQTIRDVMEQVAAETGKDSIAPPEGHTPLEESGLDSLGFAMMVARLEERLGYDPFSKYEKESYPHTFSELVTSYLRALPD